MSRVLRGFGVLVAGALGVLLPGTPPAAASSSAAVSLEVRLTVDQPVVTIDRDAPRDQLLTYEVVITNPGADPVRDVVVEVRVPGGPVQRDVGDVAPGGEWRVVVVATVPQSTTGSAPVEAVAVARASDGTEVTSPPARTDVQVISSAVYERGDEPAPAPATSTTSTTAVATEVLGETVARTGSPILPLVAVAGALVLSGAVLVRRAADDG